MKTISTILFAVFLIIGTANAGPIQWADNGHWYDVVFIDPDYPSSLDWEDARDLANSSGGYLATLTSGEENLFVWEFLLGNLADGTDYSQYWLGGWQSDKSGEPDQGWTWVTGEAWDYTNWRAGEPSNWRNIQDYLHFWSTETGEWDDMANERYVGGYIIEFEQAPVPTPEPSTLFLLGSGLIGLAGFRSRKLKGSV